MRSLIKMTLLLLILAFEQREIVRPYCSLSTQKNWDPEWLREPSSCYLGNNGNNRHRKLAFWSRSNENRSARFSGVVYFFLTRKREDLTYFKPVLSDPQMHVYEIYSSPWTLLTNRMLLRPWRTGFHETLSIGNYLNLRGSNDDLKTCRGRSPPRIIASSNLGWDWSGQEIVVSVISTDGWISRTATPTTGSGHAHRQGRDKIEIGKRPHLVSFSNLKRNIFWILTKKEKAAVIGFSDCLKLL